MTRTPAPEHWSIYSWDKYDGIIVFEDDDGIQIEFETNEYGNLRITHRYPQAYDVEIPQAAIDEFYALARQWWREFHGEEDETE